MRASAAAARRLDLRGVSRGRRLRGLERIDGPRRPPRRTPLPAPAVDPHLGGEAGVGQAPAGPVGDPGPALPRDRPRERLLERRRRLLRHRHRGLRQADDDDPACRLRDDRPADVHRLRRQRSRSTSPAAAAADLRRRARRLLDRRRRHPAQAALQRGHVRRRRARRRRRSRVPHLAGARRPCRTAAAGSCSCTPARATRRSTTARDPTTTGRSTPTRSRARTSTAGASECGPTSPGARRTLADHISAYQPLAFAPPYGSYGQDGTNDPQIPDDLLGWLTDRYDVVFTQDVNAHAQPGGGPAARPVPGHPRHHRRRPARPSSHRRPVSAITPGSPPSGCR